MIQSMTGYGKAEATYKNKTISVEVKTLNSKTFDLTTHVSMLYREKEMDIRQILSKALTRGKADISIWIETEDTCSKAPLINGGVIVDYYQQIRNIATAMGVPEPKDWFDLLLRLPDAMIKTDVEQLSDEEWEAVRGAIEEAVNNLVDFRTQEGIALEKKFCEKLDNIEALLASLEPYEKQRVEKIRNRIVDSLQQLPEVEYDRGRLEQELIYYIEKLDISEEKQRLSNHIKYFRETMAGAVGQGKKLGFIAQEMGREINTTGSKSNNAEMQNIVVMMKDELEQIKEQVLNVL